MVLLFVRYFLRLLKKHSNIYRLIEIKHTSVVGDGLAGSYVVGMPI